MGPRALGREAAQPPRYPPRRAFLLNGASMHTPGNTPSLEAVVDRWFRDSRAGAPNRPYLGPVLLSASARRAGFTGRHFIQGTSPGRPRSGRRERAILEQGVPVVAGR